MTAAQIILTAMKSLGIIASGEDATTDEYADGLLYLQMMLRGWAADRLFVHSTTADSFELTAGTSEYTLGPSGDFVTSRANKILSANLDNGEYAVEVVSEKEYTNIKDKSITGTPKYLFVRMGFPLVTLYLSPVPDTSYTLYLYSVKPFTETSSFTSVNDTLIIPAMYQETLVNALAVRLASVFGKAVPPIVLSLAVNGYAQIKKTNASDMSPRVSLSLPLSSGVYDINRG